MLVRFPYSWSQYNYTDAEVLRSQFKNHIRQAEMNWLLSFETVDIAALFHELNNSSSSSAPETVHRVILLKMVGILRPLLTQKKGIEFY